MCGIVGLLNFKSINKTLLTLMCNEIKHRGPDSTGIFLDKKNFVGLGNLRLAINDTSTRGNQPIHSFSGRYVMVYNGEIYNFKKIKIIVENAYMKAKKKINWKGNSDTEVLINGIEILGLKKMISICDGMFAFAIWDKLKKKLILARDRIGEKPLYYGFQEKFFFFSSDLKALKKNKSINLSLDKKAASMFLKYSFVPSPLSIFKGIYKVNPSSYCVIDKNMKIKFFKYYKLKNKKKFSKINNTKTTAKDMEKLIKYKINNILNADANVGCLLSGGIDSSLVLSIAQHLSEKKIEAFTIATSDIRYNEARDAIKIAKYLGANHNIYKIKKKDLLDYVTNMHQIYSEPHGDSSQIPTYLLTKFAKKKVKVLISGDGGDEVFGGYNRYVFFKNYFTRIKKFSFFIKIFKFFFQKILLYSEKKFNLNYFNIWNFSSKLNKILNVSNCKNIYDYYDNVLSVEGYEKKFFKKIYSIDYKKFLFNKENYGFEDLMFLDQNIYLPDNILSKVDRASMANSIENRSPLIDHEILEKSYLIPRSKIITKSKTKVILRDILKKYLPNSYISNIKKGFSIPLDYYLKNDLLSWANNVLQINKLNKDIFNAKEVINMWTDYKKNKNQNSSLIWNILVLQNWINKNC